MVFKVSYVLFASI